MTEDAYQAARTIMRKANYARGVITNRKGEVAKWTKIEDVHRRNGNAGQAGGALKMLHKAMKRLEEAQRKFADLDFPNKDLIVKVEPNRCDICGSKISAEETYCEQCKNQ